jgi:hypothetical protein
MKFFIAVLAAVGLRENKRIGRIAEAHRHLGQTRNSPELAISADQCRSPVHLGSANAPCPCDPDILDEELAELSHLRFQITDEVAGVNVESADPLRGTKSH